MRTPTSIPQMYADQRGLKHADLTEKLIGIFFNVSNELDHGFLEFRRYVFENERKNPRNRRESAEKKLPGSCT